MPSMDDVYGGDYLKAEDIPQEARPRLTVESVRPAEIGAQGEQKETKLVMRFLGKEKSLVLNVTNANMMAEIAGSRDYDNWPGHQVILYRTMTDFAGKRVPALRLDHPTVAPAPPKPAPPVWKPAAPIARAPEAPFVATDDDVPFGLMLAPLVSLLSFIA